MSTLALYFHTVRHLRATQVVSRVGLLLRRPYPDLRAAPPQRVWKCTYAAPIAAEATLIGPDTFRFLNAERRCATASDWRAAGMSKLWVYNLHYFDDLNARDAQSRTIWHEHLLQRWVEENPPASGDAWEPYPVSRRIVNWVKWAARGNTLSTDCRASLAVQTRWLLGRLEYHILGNHLFANAKALMYAGLFFEGPEAERWFSRGFAIVERELAEQVLRDGGHFELSTMYHAAAVEDLLDLINLLHASGRQIPVGWPAILARMQRWLQVMIHPDGEISFFNDAALGAAPTLADLDMYAIRLNLPVTLSASEPLIPLEASGYVRMAAGPACLILDCAAVGPDYLPGHAHADTLSFEMSMWGRRLFVNSGTSCYGADSERQRQRGTAAHNTVVVDSHDSSEVWGGFRVARRARVRLRAVRSTPPSATVEASHDGYRRLASKSQHLRRWTLSPNSLHIDDEITGDFKVAEAYFHLHPEVQVRVCSPREVELSWSSGGAARLTFEGAVAVSVRPDTWHPHFGVVVANHCIVAKFSSASLRAVLAWNQES